MSSIFSLKYNDVLHYRGMCMLLERAHDTQVVIWFMISTETPHFKYSIYISKHSINNFSIYLCRVIQTQIQTSNLIHIVKEERSKQGNNLFG